MPTYMLVSGKGGPGKSSKLVMTTYGLAIEIAEAAVSDPDGAGKRKILVVDLDPQAAATRRLGVQTVPGRTMAEVLDQKSPVSLRDIITPCGWDDPIVKGRVFVAPASVDLTTRDKESHLAGANRRLVKHLLDVLDEFYYVFIDLPATITHLMEIAAVAADGWIGVVQPEIDSINELKRVDHLLSVEWRDFDICPHIERLGVTANLINPNPNTQLHADGLALVEAQWGADYWKDTDTKNMARLAEMNSYGVPPHSLPNLKKHEHDYILDVCGALARRVIAHV